MMLKDITLGRYFPGKSPLHRMDASVKIILTIVYIVFVFMVKNLYGYGFLALFTLWIIRVSKVPFKYVFKGLRPVAIFMVFTAVINMFMTGTTVVWSFGFLKITSEGIYHSIHMILRIIFLVTGTSLLTFTTQPIMLTDGLEKLLKPLNVIKFPSHEIAMMMTIAMRFIPTLLDETDKIMKAQTARGADFETGNILTRTKALIPLLIPLFISAFKRADELATAMECRCYTGGENRTRLNTVKPGITDLYGVIIIGMFCGVIILLNFLR